jgi:DNA-binding PadR family transcriptional regulator
MYCIPGGYIQRGSLLSLEENHMSHDPQASIPLTAAMFQILLALADGDRHGYAIMQEVAARTGGRVRLGPGTLYRSIKRMLEEGLIEESGGRPAPEEDDERRIYYRLTKLGHRVASAEAETLAKLVRVARAKKLLPGAASA